MEKTEDDITKPCKRRIVEKAFCRKPAKGSNPVESPMNIG